MKLRFSDLWRWDGEVEPSVYLAWGVMLFAIKYNVDRVLAVWMFQRTWSPMEYLFPGRVFQLGSPDDVRFCMWMLALALPFVWVGVALTLRRLRGVGLPLWLVTLFFVPMLSLVFFAILSVLPNRNQDCRASVSGASSWIRRRLPRSSVGSALLGVVVTSLFGVGVMALSVEVFKNYGWGLFVMAPFTVGLMAVLIYGANEPKRYWECVGVACLAVAMVGAMFLVFALEGLICIFDGGTAGGAVGDSRWQRGLSHSGAWRQGKLAVRESSHGDSLAGTNAG